MNDQQHIIRRQIVQVECPSVAIADQLKRRLSQFQQTQLLPMLQAIFDELGEDLRLETLEIDLGEIPLHGMEESIAQKLPALLRAQVLAQASQQANARASGQPAHMTRTSHADPQDAQAPASPARAGNEIALLLHFLQTGSLPWWVPTEARPAQRARMEACLHAQARAIAPLLAQAAQHNPTVAQRLAAQFASDAFPEILGALSPAHAAAYQLARATLQQILGFWGMPAATLAPGGSLDRKLWAMILQDALSGRPRIGDTVAFILHTLFQSVQPQAFGPFHHNIAQLMLALHQGKLQLSASPELQTHLLRHSAAATDNIANAKIVQPDEQLLQQLAQIAGLSVTATEAAVKAARQGKSADAAPASPETQAPPAHRDSQSTQAKEKGILVHNAGLVLLWPYYQRFLEGLGLVADKKFVSDDAQWRAIHILQYIATGHENDDPEYDLTLNKLLTGHDLDAPLAAGFQLSPTEKEEADALVQAAISHWKILKQMSIPAFRGAFLCRLGKLTDLGHAWDLDVEAATFDVLVEHIPWTYSLVMLPWMGGRVHVGWA